MISPKPNIQIPTQIDKLKTADRQVFDINISIKYIQQYFKP